MRQKLLIKGESNVDNSDEKSTGAKCCDDSIKSLSKPPENPATSQMSIKLPSLASICDQTGVSDRAAANIASAALQDVGVISPSDRDMAIDRMKVRRERKRIRDHVASRQSQRLISALYFDRGKDATIVSRNVVKNTIGKL